MKRFSLEWTYNGKQHSELAIATCNPKLVIHWVPDTRYRSYTISSWDGTNPPTEICRYLPTIKAARLVAGALTGISRDGWHKDEPMFRSRDAATAALGKELLDWLFLAHNGLRERSPYGYSG